MNRSYVVSVIAVVLVTACGGNKDAAADSAAKAAAAPPPAAAPAAPAAPTAAVHIVSPKNGDSTAHDVTVSLTKDGVTIAKADNAQVEGTGHYHLFLDTIPSGEGAAIPPNSKHVVHIGSGDSTYTFKGLAPGAHQLIAVIGYGNHFPMATRRDTVNFVVKK